MLGMTLVPHTGKAMSYFPLWFECFVCGPSSIFNLTIEDPGTKCGKLNVDDMTES